ncbi:MAG: hypothetical protein AB7F65_09360 [Dehalococcoidia bacterium]
MNFRPPEIWLISGPNREQRSDLARRLGAALDRAAVVDGEALWDQIAGGRADPRTHEAEADRQYELSIRNQCLLARSYAEAGFTPVLHFPVATAYHLEAYQNYLIGARLRLVQLAAPPELTASGIIITADTPIEGILERVEDALVRRA